MDHRLKTDKAAFSEVLSGRKGFEYRKHDRPFSVGDTITLVETVYAGSEMRDGAPLIYTGRVLTRRLTYLLPAHHYDEWSDWVVLSIPEPLSVRVPREARDRLVTFAASVRRAIGELVCWWTGHEGHGVGDACATCQRGWLEYDHVIDAGAQGCVADWMKGIVHRVVPSRCPDCQRRYGDHAECRPF